MTMPTVSLFAGIGLIDLVVERSGLGKVVAQVEIDDFCVRVLEQRFPGVRRYRDVRAVGAAELAGASLIVGGSPCQDLSSANVAGRAGLAGDKSGLMFEYLRIVDEVRPRWVVAENVATWRDWLPVVRLALFRLGYASVPIRVCASDLGAPHRRARIFVVATNAHGYRESARALHEQVAELPQLAAALRQDWGQPSPRALGVADGCADRVDRNRAVGNAVVPQCMELVASFIARTEAA